MQLNTEAAAVLEVLADGPLDAEQVSRMMAAASGVDAAAIEVQLAELWPQLLALGFVQSA